jgi:hypothetical protein
MGMSKAGMRCGSPCSPRVGHFSAFWDGLESSALVEKEVHQRGNEYEVCFKCHAGSSNKPQRQGFADFGGMVYRQSMVGAPDPYNAAFAFKSTIARHNVTQPRSGANVPSLRSNIIDFSGNPTGPALGGGQIYRSDCHNSDQARSSGKTGPNGPHASAWPHLLERRYDEHPAGGCRCAGWTGALHSWRRGLETREVENKAVQRANERLAINKRHWPSGQEHTKTIPTMSEKCHDVSGQLLGGGDTVFGLHNRRVVQDQLSCSACRVATRLTTEPCRS